MMVMDDVIKTQMLAYPVCMYIYICLFMQIQFTFTYTHSQHTSIHCLDYEKVLVFNSQQIFAALPS